MATGILFDLDGTLLDTLEDLTASVNYALDQFAMPRKDVPHVRRSLGSGAKKLIERSVPAGTPEETAAQVLAVYRRHYDAHCQEKTAPYPGISGALEALAKKHPIAIVSNKPDSAVKLLCTQHFPGVYALGERPECPRKPAPDMLWQAMEAMGVRSCIYVGDSEEDILASSNAGLPCLSVLWGLRDEGQLRSAGARYLCPNTGALAQMLEEMVEELYGQ